jgi:hypothetical protein
MNIIKEEEKFTTIDEHLVITKNKELELTRLDVNKDYSNQSQSEQISEFHLIPG